MNYKKILLYLSNTLLTITFIFLYFYNPKDVEFRETGIPLPIVYVFIYFVARCLAPKGKMHYEYSFCIGAILFNALYLLLPLCSNA